MQKRFYFVAFYDGTTRQSDIYITLAKSEEKAEKKIRKLTGLYYGDSVDSYGEFDGKNPECYKNAKPDYLYLNKDDIRKYSEKEFLRIKESLRDSYEEEHECERDFS